MKSIPLSWCRKDANHPEFKSVKLSLSGLSWIHSADVPHDCYFKDLHTELLAKFAGGFLIRGCNDEIARYLARKGCSVMRTGAEGIIDLKGISESRPSVNELVRRGLRWGGVEEIPFTESNAGRVAQFIARTAHSDKPYLKYLFRSRFDPGTRCFAFRTANGEWLGAITVSGAQDSHAHTELILRHIEAPPGVMEALFVGVMNVLRNDGYEKFSLGEVPFITPRSVDASRLSIKEKMLFKSGHLLKFAFNYKGLYSFKDKFNPKWRPVYICAAPALPYSALADLFIVSRYLDLSGSEIIKAVRNIGPAFVKSA